MVGDVDGQEDRGLRAPGQGGSLGAEASPEIADDLGPLTGHHHGKRPP